MEQEGEFQHPVGEPHAEGSGEYNASYNEQESWGPEHSPAAANEMQPGDGLSPSVERELVYQAIYADGLEADAAIVARVNAQIEAASADNQFSEVPEDPVIKRQYIQRLFEAFVAVDLDGPDQIIDKPSKAGALAQAAQRMKDQKYPAHAIEEACWEIFKKAEIAQLGVRFVDAHHSLKFENHAIHPTFDSRWNSIVTSCRRSKALCKMLLDPPYIDRFISNPTSELKMKLNNKKINAQRDEQNEIGRTFLSSGLGKHEAVVLLKEAKGDDILDSEDDDNNLGLAQLYPENPATPQTASRARPARVASSKRKKWSEGDSDLGEADDDYVDSSFRSNHKSSRRSIRSQASHRTPTQDVGSTSKTPRSATQKLSNRSSARKPTNQRRLAMALPTAQKGNLNRRSEDHYKRTILRILGIDESLVKLHEWTLEDLRVYARAYNTQYQTLSWKSPQFPGWDGYNHTITDGEKVHEHFTMLIKDLLPLAVARGDMLESGEINPTGNKFFQTKDVEDGEALGLIRNEFGFHRGYPNIQPAILPSQAHSASANSYHQDSTNGYGGYPRMQVADDQQFPSYQYQQYNSHSDPRYHQPGYEQHDYKDHSSHYDYYGPSTGFDSRNSNDRYAHQYQPHHARDLYGSSASYQAPNEQYQSGYPSNYSAHYPEPEHDHYHR